MELKDGKLATLSCSGDDFVQLKDWIRIKTYGVVTGQIFTETITYCKKTRSYANLTFFLFVNRQTVSYNDKLMFFLTKSEHIMLYVVKTCRKNALNSFSSLSFF